MSENINYEEEILMQVRKIMRAIEIHSSKLAILYGLTTPQLILMKKLSKKGSMKPGIVAREISLSHATVTGIVKRLEAKGLIVRQKDLVDGRSFQVSLTDKGNELLKSMPPMLQDDFVKKLGSLEDWEKTLILSSLQRVTTMMHAEEIEAAPVLLTGSVGASVEEYSKAKELNGDSAVETVTEEEHANN
jgi:DNA-binding MarR family transcriptional regulator